MMSETMTNDSSNTYIRPICLNLILLHRPVTRRLKYETYVTCYICYIYIFPHVAVLLAILLDVDTPLQFILGLDAMFYYLICLWMYRG